MRRREHMDPRRAPRRRLMLLAALVLAAVLWPRHGVAVKPSEYEVKAACIYQFINFVKWPGHEAGAEPAEVVIGILGNDPFGSSFGPVEGRPLPGSGTVVRVRRFGAWSPGMNLAGIQVLFIAGSENENLVPILASLSGRPTLTVSDCDRFLERGGMINLITLDHRVRWEINRRPAIRSRLELSSQILRLALRVVDI